MDYGRKFCFDQGLLGEGISSEDAVGVSYPDGTTQGAADNVELRFDASYMEMASSGAL